ncbi:MAG: hypothetical protein NTY02_20620 [Acidobacteria bacterium]|nr:hypothetical protein [Acidobacteriota bacterium]
MNWVAFTAAKSGPLLPQVIAAALPMFAAGVGRPNLLEEETAAVRSAVQDAITTDPKNVLPDDPTLIPQGCLNDASYVLAARLATLMVGSSFAPTLAKFPDGLQSQAIRADMTLREMRMGHFSTRDREELPPPSYIPGPDNEATP